MPATFFEIGEQISTYGEGGAIERRMLADGDMIGDHTWSHPDVAGAGAFARRPDRRRPRRRSGPPPTASRRACSGRPTGPSAAALISEARSLGFHDDPVGRRPASTGPPRDRDDLATGDRGAHPGAIILQHDGGGNRSETLAALPQEITTLKRQGYRFVTVTQMLGQKLIYK